MRRLNELHNHKKTAKKPEPTKAQTIPVDEPKTKLKIPVIYEFSDGIFSATCPLFEDILVKDPNLEKVRFDIKLSIQNKFNNETVDLELFQSRDYDVILIDV